MVSGIPENLIFIFFFFFFSVHHLDSLNLQWFFNDSCVASTDFNNPYINDTAIRNGLNFDSLENKHRIIHFSVYLGLLLVGFLEILFGLSQILIGFLGCLCDGVSKPRRNQIV